MCNTRHFLFVLLSCCALAFTGCNQILKSEQTPVKYQYQLGQVCSTPIVMRVGDILQFSAPENPSTGFEWRLKQPLSLMKSNSSYAPHAHSKEMVGAGGTRTFNFVMSRKGTEQIMLEYVRTDANATNDERPAAETWQCKLMIQQPVHQ